MNSMEEIWQKQMRSLQSSLSIVKKILALDDSARNDEVMIVGGKKGAAKKDHGSEVINLTPPMKDIGRPKCKITKTAKALGYGKNESNGSIIAKGEIIKGIASTTKGSCSTSPAEEEFINKEPTKPSLFVTNKVIKQEKEGTTSSDSTISDDSDDEVTIVEGKKEATNKVHDKDMNNLTPLIKHTGRPKRNIKKTAKAKEYGKKETSDNSDDEIIGKRFANLKRRRLVKKKN